ncbi:MAG TPA: ethanolamine ammonia-lyase light chain EutC, partial [Dongiaceae bacterium]|nr:ethanolamine ammonia-lyase light chain EutC [Dongiaceae bacterium]
MTGNDELNVNGSEVPAESHVTQNAWSVLRDFTPARIGLGRAGSSLSTRVNLQFQLDHARARDAVLAPLDLAAMERQLADSGLPVRTVRSQAADRRSYLQRPDLGRSLHPDDAEQLRESRLRRAAPWDIVILVADGLSSLAVA